MALVKFNASQVVAAGAEFLQLIATSGPNGFVSTPAGPDTYSIATVTSGSVVYAVIDETVRAIAIDPTSDFDVALVLSQSLDALVSGSPATSERIVGVGAPLVGLLRCDPANRGTPPVPLGGLIGVTPGPTVVPIPSPQFRAYGFWSAYLPAFFAGGFNNEVPQFVANVYFAPPPTLPMYRPHKGFANVYSIEAPHAPLRYAFFGRSKFYAAYQNNGALAGNATIATYAVFFCDAGPNLRYEQIDSQVIAAPGGSVHFGIQNLMCDAIEVRITGTDGDVINFNGYVADLCP